MKTVEQAYQSKENNFDLLRIIAALLVIASHSFPLAGSRNEPFTLLGGFDTGGGWGVSVFFVISGFLVTKSVMERSIFDYFKSRFFRVVPALILVTLFTVFILGPVLTEQPISNFFQNPVTWEYLLTPTVFWMGHTLPGVFEENPVPGINGSLWTLPIECSFYIILPLLGALGLLSRRVYFLLPLTIGIILLYGIVNLGWKWDSQGGALLRGVPVYSGFKNGLLFSIGGFFWIYRKSIPLDPGVALGGILLLVIAGFQDGRLFAFMIALPYLTIYFALARPFRFRLYERLGDLSYGAYIFAFPVQQAMVSIFENRIGPLTLMAVSMPTTLMMATISWHLVEKRAIKMRRRLGKSRS